ncbi:iron-containing redox enzyme family protein [Actinophytocola sp.]|uniref:iron-containing redox enzyme family protein n=1 Tax=Actinophytocola sp. TaxID=1872138 RepID=UPI002ED20357
MNDTFELPDTMTALPSRPFEFSKLAVDETATILAAEPDVLFHRLLRDQESESTFLAARRILSAFLPADATDSDTLAAQLLSTRDELAAVLRDLAHDEDVLRQRAPLSLLGGCWLEAVSQPATQPAIIVNRLYAQHFRQRGEGNPQRAVHNVRRRAMEAMGVYLPEIGAADFLRRANARQLTALHACFYLALTRLPANFLPEVVGVHHAFHTLGVDDLLAGTSPVLSEQELRDVLTEYLGMADEPTRHRTAAAIQLVITLEREHVAMLAELSAWRAGLSLESRVAEIIARHAPMAGRQHGGVRIGELLLSDTFGEPDLDLAAFLAEFRESRQLRPEPDGPCRFIRAMKFGGPMFGIFDEREAATFRDWVATVQAGHRPEIVISPNTVGDGRAQAWRRAIADSAPADVVIAEPEPFNDRELFYRLANIENFPNTLPLARQRAERYLADAEILFTHGAAGRYTDATWFEYSAEALYERAERVYWDKLVDPYSPLETIPDRDEVIFTQTTYLLGYLIDGAWLHRLGHLGHGERDSDAMLFSIYADEMGHGDLRKNHITLTHRVIASLGLRLPHIRDAAFMEQDELPDDLYGFSIHQLCMCLHPDRFYNEILGYNLAIEMFGSGELRLHEAQKLRHHGFDDCYEAAHLAIDNFSAGHTRQAADIIVSYLDSVARTVGEAAVGEEWRRVWRGYASFAYFVEHQLLRGLTSPGDDLAELMI